MDLVGQSLAFWMSGETLNQAFPRFDRPPLTGIWMLWGSVKGETPGVGLWIEVHAANKDSPRLLEVMPEETWTTFLCRWEWIIGASVSPELPRDVRRFGFLG
jgi:hypothetical protein